MRFRRVGFDIVHFEAVENLFDYIEHGLAVY